MIANDITRCIGHGAGPSGHQVRADCLDCELRTAPRPAGMVSFIDPPKEYPCPLRRVQQPCGRFG